MTLFSRSFCTDEQSHRSRPFTLLQYVTGKLISRATFMPRTGHSKPIFKRRYSSGRSECRGRSTSLPHQRRLLTGNNHLPSRALFHARRPRRAWTQVSRKSSARNCDGFELGLGIRRQLPAPESGGGETPLLRRPTPIKEARCRESGTGVRLAGRPVFPHRHTPPSPTRERGTSGELARSQPDQRCAAEPGRAPLTSSR